jgi:hypothetical protein
LHAQSFLIDEAGVRTAMPVDEIERITGEVVGIAASHTFDEVSVLVAFHELVSVDWDGSERCISLLRAISQIKSDDMLERFAILKPRCGNLRVVI